MVAKRHWWSSYGDVEIDVPHRSAGGVFVKEVAMKVVKVVVELKLTNGLMMMLVKVVLVVKAMVLAEWNDGDSGAGSGDGDEGGVAINLFFFGW